MKLTSKEENALWIGTSSPEDRGTTLYFSQLTFHINLCKCQSTEVITGYRWPDMANFFYIVQVDLVPTENAITAHSLSREVSTS